MHRFSGSPHASNPLTGNLLHLPNGINVIVTPVFGGFYFKVHELNTHQSAFPPGWTIVIHSIDEADDAADDEPADSPYAGSSNSQIYRYRVPTLRNDALFISSISNPSNNDFRPAISPSRELAMMLWATLWWYFHQPRPEAQPSVTANTNVGDANEPKLDWRIQIKRDGILKGRNVMSKLERMGLVATEDSSVGAEVDDRHANGYSQMFVSQCAFWQIDARIFLFTLSPTGNSPFPASSPRSSRPSSPNRDSGLISPRLPLPNTEEVAGPFQSQSHLPTYYPPSQQQYTVTNRVRHPLRPKPPRQGETFYTRYVPSTGQYLSFRVASLSPKSVVYKGPLGYTTPSFLPPHNAATMDAAMGHLRTAPSDTELLHRWMNNERIINGATWEGCGQAAAGPVANQEAFLKSRLASNHSFPAIGCWDGKPFGYFEIYWLPEDPLGTTIAHPGRYDRGLHMLVGEEEFRGPDRVRVWLSALVHYCWLADNRTETVVADPNVQQERLVKYFEECSFKKDSKIVRADANLYVMKVTRDGWVAPFL